MGRKTKLGRVHGKEYGKKFSYYGFLKNQEIFRSAEEKAYDYATLT